MATEVKIPIADILREYSVYAEDIASALAERAKDQIIANAKRLFKKKTGNLFSHIRRKKSKYHTDMYIVGSSSPHAHLLEYGHAIVKKGVVVGHVPGRPFIAPVEEGLKGQIKAVAEEVLRDKAIIIEGK